MGLTQVNTDGVKDDAVTLAKQAAGTDGQVITYDASGNPKAIGPGTDGQVLTSAGAGAEPAFEDAVSEGTQVKSTGESGGTKFLREDGDGTCSWQTLPSSGATLSGSTNNTVVTVTGSNAMQGEANLTYDGTTALLKTTSDGNAINVVRNSADANPVNISLTKSRNATHGSFTKVENADVLGEIVWKADDGTDYASECAAIRVDIDGLTGGNDVPSRMEFFTTADGAASASKRLTINKEGNVQVEDGNLQILTSGHGVEFSAFGANDANNLNDYEEGTWTADVYHQGSQNNGGQYTKIGRLVIAHFKLQTLTATGNNNHQSIASLPFTIKNVTASCGVARGYQTYNLTGGPVYEGSPNSTQVYLYTNTGNNINAVDIGGKWLQGAIVYITDS